MRLSGLALPDQNAAFALDNRGHDLDHGNIGAYRPMYPDALLDHFQNPRNVGELPPPAITVEASNPACGDILRLSARIENGVVAEARFKVRGCTASIAAGSALTEWLSGEIARGIGGFRAGEGGPSRGWIAGGIEARGGVVRGWREGAVRVWKKH